MYKEFVEKILDNLFGENKHSVFVVETELVNSDKNKKVFQIIISPGKDYISKVVGKNGETINLIVNLVKIKGYLNNCQIIVDIAK